MARFTALAAMWAAVAVPTTAAAVAPTLSALLSTPNWGMSVRRAYQEPLSQKPSSEQPIQPWPAWMGKEVPSFQRMVEQALVRQGSLMHLAG